MCMACACDMTCAGTSVCEVCPPHLTALCQNGHDVYTRGPCILCAGQIGQLLYTIYVAVTGRKQHYSTVSRLIGLVISLECFIETTPDFLCPFMND